MNIDFKALAIQIEAATRKAFQEIVTVHGSEDIYGFALYSDEGAMTVCPSTNTQDYLETKPKQDYVYYKYEPAEWCYEGDGADEDFSAICNTLYNALEGDFWAEEEDFKEEEYEEIDDEEFEAFQQTLYQTCIAVLVKLKQEEFFKQIVGKDIFLMFSVTDYEYDRQELEEMIITLNDNPYQQEYLDWMKTWRK
ncbi:DUF4303 domain-containing protein [Myroides albus]|uniref:DUF4303 domain-containing protein n=1 Tax=Myroides albus TaxID=2562892 RepID=A0A6I3LIZ2_9FLAO|nr:DUF4303 domain-containing protein [Myroides albus]MTG98213.1 DUF4303 domain-containing protein [Myroides albus]UVD79332.1 DUF4303 domain-containing protein [Myroides albus]